MRFWWANQNQTFRQETEGGYLWSPQRNRDGSTNPFYEAMRELAPGDFVFSFSDTWIRKVGIVEGYCYQCPRPTEFGAAGRAWNDIGWSVRVRYILLHNPIRPKDHIELLRPLLPPKYSPLNDTGHGYQRYLVPLSDALGRALANTIGAEFEALIAASAVIPVDVQSRGMVEYGETEEWDRHLVNEVSDNSSLDTTEREAIIQARIGQGLFRKNVALIETHCRITGVNEPTHLRASHTKPWRTSSDAERINGENGLLLTPTVDHLFDRGFIAFEDNGEPRCASTLVWHQRVRMRILPDPDHYLRDATDFVFDSQLGRRALTDPEPRNIAILLREVVALIYKLTTSCQLPEFTEHGLPHLCSLIDRICRWTTNDTAKQSLLVEQLSLP